MKVILRRLTSLHIVRADMVEVSPLYDDLGESTAWAAADFIYELFGLMVMKPLYSVNGYIPKKVFRGSFKKSKSKGEL